MVVPVQAMRTYTVRRIDVPIVHIDRRSAECGVRSAECYPSRSSIIEYPS